MSNLNLHIMPEMICLIFSILLLIIIFTTKPLKTQLYKFVTLGTLFSILDLILHILIICNVNGYLNYSNTQFAFICFAYLVIYGMILATIFTYICFLSFEIHFRSKKTFLKIGLVFAIYVFIEFSLLCMGTLYTQDANGQFTLLDSFHLYIVFGIVDSIISLLVSIKNRKTIPRVVFTYIFTMVPLDFLLLVLQLVFIDVPFVGITYVAPFYIFYLLFHSNPFNHFSGCQNQLSLEAKISENLSLHKGFMILTVKFPRLRDQEENISQELFNYILSNRCRQIEKLNRKIKIYSKNFYTYMFILNDDSYENAEMLLQQTLEILNDSPSEKYSSNKMLYKISMFHAHSCADNLHKIRSLDTYLSSKLTDPIHNESYIATEDDYLAFAEYYSIKQHLLDIQRTQNLDDPRIKCYAQPIYNVSKKCFSSAEALMRLELDGKLIYPDKFIALSEEINCIHTLTLIMLHKICRIIKELDTVYDFEAITLNCSTVEFSDEHLHEELLQIIQKSNIPVHKIRIELTESTMTDSYNSIIYNMEKLKEAGIAFYLDDFGTGYSNLERIFSCPFKTIKFDKSMLYKSLENESMEELMSNMVDIFKRKGYVALVEGVENEEQSMYSIAHGFDYIQGYQYARPVPIENLTQFFPKIKNWKK